MNYNKYCEQNEIEFKSKCRQIKKIYKNACYQFSLVSHSDNNNIHLKHYLGIRFDRSISIYIYIFKVIQ